MKKISTKLLILLMASFVFVACSSDNDDNGGNNNNNNNNNNGSGTVVKDDVGKTIGAVSALSAKPTVLENEITVSWKNPESKDLLKVEVSYATKSVTTKASASPLLLDAESEKDASCTIVVPKYSTYIITVVAINKAGVRSAPQSVEVTPFKNSEDVSLPVFIERADAMMRACFELFLGGPRNIWSTAYPRNTAEFWDGDALVWGQGGGFSGYATLREASIGTALESYYKTYDSKMYTDINKFITADNGINAYAVYPEKGNDRYYDDNVWIGIDMIDLYTLTESPQYLEKAVMVWNYLQKGTDNVTGGGIYWQEYKEQSKSKHTCSSAPGAVLAAKLYMATGESKYLQNAKALYVWLKKVMQDPTDYLFWDNARMDGGAISIDKNKFSYNSGQPMQAAVLLYKITGEESYLTDAQNIAKSAHSKWFRYFYSAPLDMNINIISDGGNDGTWFNAVLLRGFVELYKAEVDKYGRELADRTYITDFERTLSHAWLSDCRQDNGLMNNDFTGVSPQKNSSWGVLSQGATVEMLARLGSLEKEGL